jgi:hypothetical protein
MVLFAENKRRGNPLLHTKNKEVFNSIDTITLLRGQCEEIASGMRQRAAKFLFNSFLAEPRNDELWCERRIVCSSQKFCACEKHL